jgi:hypothetical protein
MCPGSHIILPITASFHGSSRVEGCLSRYSDYQALTASQTWSAPILCLFAAGVNRVGSTATRRMKMNYCDSHIISWALLHPPRPPPASKPPKATIPVKVDRWQIQKACWMSPCSSPIELYLHWFLPRLAPQNTISRDARSTLLLVSQCRGLCFQSPGSSYYRFC